MSAIIVRSTSDRSFLSLFLCVFSPSEGRADVVEKDRDPSGDSEL